VAVIRISGKTNLFIITRAIVSGIHKHKYAEVQALGFFSVRRAEQAIGRAASLLGSEGTKIVYKYRMIEPDIEGNEKEGVRFMIRVLEAPLSQPGPGERLIEFGTNWQPGSTAQPARCQSSGTAEDG
jgi:stage V sporulation protein SpoVS